VSGEERVHQVRIFGETYALRSADPPDYVQQVGQYVDEKFYDIAKVLTEVHDTMIISTGAVSRAWLNKLPADLRRLVIEEGRKLQPRLMEHSRALDAAMRTKWAEAGGSFVTLPDADAGKVKSMLANVGDEVTKGNPAVAAFYKRLKTTAAKY